MSFFWLGRWKEARVEMPDGPDARFYFLVECRACGRVTWLSAGALCPGCRSPETLEAPPL